MQLGFCVACPKCASFNTGWCQESQEFYCNLCKTVWFQEDDGTWVIQPYN